jgi:serine/threonine protein kinase
MSFLLFFEKASTDLSHFLKQNAKYFVEEEKMHQFMSQMLCIFSYFNQNNVVHRDVKPGNILLFNTANSPVFIFKVSDLGFAKNLTTQNAKSSAIFRGSLGYVAPELKRAFLNPTEVINWNKCDMFSLGLVFLTVCGVNVDGLNEGTYEEVQNKINKEIDQIAKIYKNENPIIKVFRCVLVADPENRAAFSDLPLDLVKVFTIKPESATEERVKELEKALQIAQLKVKELEINLATKETSLFQVNSEMDQLQLKQASQVGIVKELEKKNSEGEATSRNLKKVYRLHNPKSKIWK